MLQAELYKEQAVICFIIDGPRILLIEKLRGLGVGKINGPGGKLEANETYLQAAIRETQEEVLLTAINPESRGKLGFRFLDGYSLFVEVFVAHDHRGVAGSTPEAKPFWCDLQQIPYERMWADDILWLPQVLVGKKIQGIFNFDGDTILDAQVSVIPS